MTAAVCPGAQTALVERLLARTKRVGDCLNWDSVEEGRVPRVRLTEKSFSVRALLYAGLVGPLAPGVRIKTTCGNPLCVSPNHMAVRAPGKPRAVAVRPVAFEVPVAVPVRSFVFDGSELGVNAFTAILGACT